MVLVECEAGMRGADPERRLLKADTVFAHATR